MLSREALSEENLIPSAADNLRFKKKVENQPKSEQIEIDLSYAFEEEKPKKPASLNFDQKTGTFFVKEENPQPEENTVDNFVENKEKTVGTSQSYPLHSTDNVEKVDNSDVYEENFVEKNVDKNNLENLSTVDKKAEDETEIFFEQEIALHPEFDLSTVKERELDQTIRKLEEEKPTQRFPRLEYFGQMHGTYLFAQSKEGLYIIDQHAAQERIKYEYFREKIGEVSNDLQELLVPFVLDYPNSDALKLKEKMDLLVEAGIHLEEFGQNSFIVRAHPTWYPSGEEEAIIDKRL
jgi:DNA mismatch repair protein MutL